VVVSRTIPQGGILATVGAPSAVLRDGGCATVAIHLAGPPRHDVPAPSPSGASLRPPPQVVWQNALGGLTFEMGAASARAFVKWAPAGSGLDLAAEAARMAWAGPFTAVPHVLDHGSAEEGAWLVTSPLPGRPRSASGGRRSRRRR
jgi:hypothetical protein